MEERLIIQIIIIIIGFILLIKGADFIVDGGSSIAKKFKISEIVIGMSIISIGTSMPELIISIKSALNGYSDISIGNVIGSNMANFLILGICTLINTIPIKRQTKFIENEIAVLSISLLLFFANNSLDYIIDRTEGVILFTCCIIFILYNIIMVKQGNKFDKVEEEYVEEKGNKKISIIKSIFFIIIGGIALKFGGDFVVDNAVDIAKKIGITEKIISISIIALGTSLPELVTSIIAIRKNDVDMAVGNLIGSRYIKYIFNNRFICYYKSNKIFYYI